MTPAPAPRPCIRRRNGTGRRPPSGRRAPRARGPQYCSVRSLGERARGIKAGLLVPGLALLTAALALIAAAAIPAAAQGPGLGAGEDAPVEINADEGIEWRQQDNVYIARGNASAARGDVTVRAETLTAHYRSTPEGGTDIWRIDADGKVSISAPSGTAYGDKGVYDVVNGVLVLRGGNLRMDTETYTVTARDSLEYWEPRRMAVARGDAVVVSDDKRLQADVVAAYLADAPAGQKPAGQKQQEGDGAGPTGDGGNRLERIEAFGNVLVTSPNQVARAERGIYVLESGIATLFGSVKITRDQDQLNGEYGEVNLNTGVSKLLSGPPGKAGAKRVRGLFSPKKKPAIEPREQGGSARPAP